MSERRVIANLVVTANVISLAGSIAVAWGVHRLVSLGVSACGGDFEPPCPPEATPAFIALGLGMPAAILGGIVGWKLVAFALLPAVGVGLLLGASNLTGDARSLPTFLGLAFVTGSLVPAFLFRRFRRRAQRQFHQAMRLLNEGRPAIGRVTDIRDTGVTINDDPQVQMTIHIVPEDGSPPFDGQKTNVVSRVDLPHRGRRYPVWYDPADTEQFVIVTKVDDTSSASIRALFEKATAYTNAESGGASAESDDRLDRLAKLNELRLAGALTEEEFAAEKASLLRA